MCRQACTESLERLISSEAKLAIESVAKLAAYAGVAWSYRLASPASRKVASAKFVLRRSRKMRSLARHNGQLLLDPDTNRGARFTTPHYFHHVYRSVFMASQLNADRFGSAIPS